jgi:hypothetical protein
VHRTAVAYVIKMCVFCFMLSINMFLQGLFACVYKVLNLGEIFPFIFRPKPSLLMGDKKISNLCQLKLLYVDCINMRLIKRYGYCR